ncbi:hypothetical protein OIO90_000486 [Microbotryomycetes sp. JL221]|nr:hypothetical protein OIO90_000486 [Microbotryomycetes sp. JL221]
MDQYIIRHHNLEDLITCLASSKADCAQTNLAVGPIFEEWRQRQTRQTASPGTKAAKFEAPIAITLYKQDRIILLYQCLNPRKPVLVTPLERTQHGLAIACIHEIVTCLIEDEDTAGELLQLESVDGPLGLVDAFLKAWPEDKRPQQSGELMRMAWYTSSAADVGALETDSGPMMSPEHLGIPQQHRIALITSWDSMSSTKQSNLIALFTSLFSFGSSWKPSEDDFVVKVKKTIKRQVLFAYIMSDGDVEERIVGYASVGRATTATVAIRGVCVDEKQRGQGIATKLVSYIAQYYTSIGMQRAMPDGRQVQREDTTVTSGDQLSRQHSLHRSGALHNGSKLQVCLFVEDDNVAAIRAYVKAGFELDAEIWRRYSQTVESARAMTRGLLGLATQLNMTSKTIILLGATGETGRQALAAALSSSAISQIYSFGRRAPDTVSATDTTKLTHTPIDFDKLLQGDMTEANKLSSVNADAVVIALGTTRAAAGSLENFYKIDREYVLSAAKHARVEGKAQSVIYCSSGSGSSSSWFPYLKSKGLTEEGLASLGYNECIIFKPGMLAVPGGRKEHRLAESLAAKVTGLISRFTDSIEIKTPILGKAMIRAAAEGQQALATAGLGREETLKGHKAWMLGNGNAIKAGTEA